MGSLIRALVSSEQTFSVEINDFARWRANL